MKWKDWYTWSFVQEYFYLLPYLWQTDKRKQTFMIPITLQVVIWNVKRNSFVID